MNSLELNLTSLIKTDFGQNKKIDVIENKDGFSTVESCEITAIDA